MSTTPNMSLVLAVVNSTPGTSGAPSTGTDWGTLINNALSKVDLHDHSSGKGVKVTASGISITSALDFAGNDATTVRAIALQQQSGALAGGLNERVYDIGGNLYWRNAGGADVQITNGGGLNAGALVSNVWTWQAVSTNLVIGAGTTTSVFAVDTSSGRTITLPLANAIAGGAGRYLWFTDATGTSETNPITLTPSGGDTISGVFGSLSLHSAYGVWGFVSDGVSKWAAILPNTIGGVQGASVQTMSPPLTTGNGLYAIAGTKLAFGALNLAGGAGYVSGVLPAANLPSSTTGALGLIQLAQDLAGTATAPTVLALTGNAGALTVRSTANAWTLDQAAASWTFTHAAKSSPGAGGALSLVAQNANGAGNNGGAITLTTGTKGGGSDLAGAFRVNVSGTTAGVWAGEVRSLQLVASLASVSPVTTSDVDVNCGSGVQFVRNAAIVPSAASPVGGGVLYANAGRFGWAAPGLFSFELDGSTTGSVGALSQYLKIWLGGVLFKIPLYN